VLAVVRSDVGHPSAPLIPLINGRSGFAMVHYLIAMGWLEKGWSGMGEARVSGFSLPRKLPTLATMKLSRR
jgi:hypothetical protein